MHTFFKYNEIYINGKIELLCSCNTYNCTDLSNTYIIWPNEM